ncbi:MAG: DUF5916 domain-containing protein [Vicinamibacterales bacterium]
MTCKPMLFALVVCLTALTASAQPSERMATIDAEGNMTLRAVKLTAPLRLDGQLDEALYTTVAPASDFIQMEPKPGTAATEKTDVWVAFDATNIYVTVRCWDSRPPSGWIMDEMRRDSNNIPRNENVAFFFDTFYDKRTALLFEVTPLGAFYDAQASNLRPGSADWNPLWRQAVGRFEGGWTAEMALPFKSLRYQPGASQTWGFNLRRTVRWKNEESFMIKLPLIAGFSGAAAIFQIANSAKLVGIEAPAASKNIEIKPYAVANVATDRISNPRKDNDGDTEVGLDFKYGVTNNLTADFTYNTDFAQVEIDNQQVNLTRFSLFFPEKREFFLEGQSIFDFGGASSGGAGAGGTTPLLFFSRRIGLNGGLVIPIQGGGRLTGRAGAFTVGAMDVQTDDDALSRSPSTNFSVLRMRRDLLTRSSIGMIYTGRSNAALGTGRSQTVGVDANFNLRNFVTINTYAAKTDTPALSGDDTSYRIQASLNRDRYGVEFDRLAVGDNFNPEVGFVQRDDFRRTNLLARFSPRPKNNRLVRKYYYQGSIDRFVDKQGEIQSRNYQGYFSIELQNTDRLTAQVNSSAERLVRPFTIYRGVTLPVGRYDFNSANVSMSLGNQRALSGSIGLDVGTFYNGNKTSLTFGGARARITPQLSLEPAVSVNWISLTQGEFRNSVLSTRTTYTVTPRMFVSGLVQYASATRTTSTNVRFRWEYVLGSEMFLVYSDELDASVKGFPDLRNRAIVFKINRMFRF